ASGWAPRPRNLCRTKKCPTPIMRFCSSSTATPTPRACSISLRRNSAPRPPPTRNSARRFLSLHEARMPAIGIFDSGVGGLTVLRALRARYPNADFVYLGDTARVPYGNKSPETITRYAHNAAQYLLDRGCDSIVIACNTASAFAAAPLRERLHVPVIDVIAP